MIMSPTRIPICPDTPAKTFRTVPPSSIVRREVESPRLAAMLMACRIWAGVAPRRRAVAVAAQIAPQVPCGCIDGRNWVEMPTRAPTSYPIAMAARNSRPLTGRSATLASAAGTVCMPGCPLENWWPSSVSSVVPAVPFNSAAMPADLVWEVPTRRAGPSPVCRDASAATSGSAAPPTIAPIESARISAVRSITDVGRSDDCVVAANFAT